MPVYPDWQVQLGNEKNKFYFVKVFPIYDLTYTKSWLKLIAEHVPCKPQGFDPHGLLVSSQL